MPIDQSSLMKESPENPKTTFVYTGLQDGWVGMGESLYQTEPVVREVLDRCDKAIWDERNASLLDVMFGRGDAVGDLDDVSWQSLAFYAIQVALTAFWRGAGILPEVVFGQGMGGIAAAQSAGAITLEGGLRLVSALTDPQATFPGITPTTPSLTLIDSATGMAIQTQDELDDAYWRTLAAENTASQPSIEAPVSDWRGVDCVHRVNTGPTNAGGPFMAVRLRKRRIYRVR